MQVEQQRVSKRQLPDLIAGLFAIAYKPFNFGAFGMPKRGDITDALASDCFIYHCNAAGLIVAVALFKILRQDSHHTDFSGRRCSMMRGSLFVQHLGVLPGYEAEAVPLLLLTLRQRAKDSQIWIEIQEENMALREQVDGRLGFRYVATKIKASSDIRGLYTRTPHSALLPVLSPCEVPSLLCITPHFLSPEELITLRRELQSYIAHGKGWGQHYSYYNKRHSWTAFSLRGYLPEDPSFIIKPAEMSKKWKAAHLELLTASCSDTVAARHFPFATRIAERIPGCKERVRFMRLASHHGELARHADITDLTAGIKDGGVARLHIPLETHEQVVFEGWGLRGEHYEMHFAAGGLYYIDQRKPHRVVNRSPVDRIHFVVDVYASSELRNWMRC